MNKLFEIKDILEIIGEYIYDDNNLFDICKSLRNMKLKYYKLNRTFSLEYYDNILFRNLIDSKLSIKNKLLSLNLNKYYYITDVSVNKLILYGC